MPDVSARGAGLPASPIRKLSPFADEAKRKGIKVYHLNIGQPDLPTPEKAMNAIRNIDSKTLAYSPSQGILPLREEFVKYYRKFGIDLTPDEIIVTSGGSEALLATFLTCFDPGDEVIITEPGYANYIGFAKATGLIIKPVTSRIEDKFALPSAEDFRKAITPKTKAILICNPNNPTGYLYSPDELFQLKELVQENNLFLIADEVYREFVYTSEPYVSALSLFGIEDNVIVVDSVSKRYNLCGCRIGCIISHNEEVMKAAMKYAQARLCPPIYGQLAALGALDTPDSYFEEVKKEYITRRDYMIGRMLKMPGVYSPLPMGAFYTVAEIPVDNAENFAKWMLTEFRHEGQTTMVTPAASFYKTPGAGINHIRAAYVLEVPELEKAMDVLEAGLQQYPGRTI